MKMNDLNFYEAPKMDVLELELEQAVLSASTDYIPQEGQGW
jgi:hypothetical protein